MATEAQSRLKTLRRKRWNKAEMPYFNCCLTCALSCEMTITHRDTSYNLFTCPRKDRGEPVFPYKYKEMLEQHNKEQQEKR